MADLVIANLLAVLKGETGDFTAKMAEASAQLKGVEAEGSGAFSKLGSVATTALVGIAGAAVTVGAASIGMASKFDAAMEQIHTQAGASQAEVDSMKNSVLSLAGQVATSPDALAEALFHVESAGYRGAQAMDILKTAAEGAKIGNANLTDVTNALDAAVVSGIPGVQNMSDAMGSLNAIVGAGDMTMQDLSDAMSTGILAVGKTVGLSLNDLGAALATLGDNNIRGSEAATKLRTALLMIEAPSSKAAGALSTIGISQTELADDMRKPNGMITMLEDLQTHLKNSGKDATEQAQVIAEAFGGSKTAGTMMILLDQMDRMKSKFGEIGAGSSKFGEDWAATQDQFKTKVDALKSSAEALGIQLGNVLIPIVTRLAGDLAQGVTWVEAHRQAFVNAWNQIQAIVVPIIQKIQQIIRDFEPVFKDIDSWIDGLVQKWDSGTGSMGETATRFQKIWDDIQGTVKAATTAIIGLFNDLSNIVMQLWDRFGNQLLSHLTTAWNAIVQVLQGFFQVVEGIWEIFAGLFTGNWHKMWQGLIDMFDGAWNVFIGAFKFAINGISTIIGAAGAVISEAWGGIWHGLATMMTALWSNAIEPAIKWVLNKMIDVINTMIDTIGAPLSIAQHIPGLGSVVPNLPHIPHLAEGGITTGPTLALIGDNPGGREAIIPLPAGGGGGLGGVTVIVQGNVLDGNQLGNMVHEALLSKQRRTGNLGFMAA